MLFGFATVGNSVLAHSILENFDVILLDVNGTFMFGQDRFGPDQDYATTYRQLGGVGLDGDRVETLTQHCIDDMTRIGRDPAHFADFPSVGEALDMVVAPDRLALEERRKLAEVIAVHEIGQVPGAYAEVLRFFAKSHRLGVVSNIWSEKSLWLQALEDAGIDTLFETLVWSSDGRAIKPSQAIFQRAIDAFDTALERIVFVGDNPMRDIDGAKNMGLAAIWINDGTRNSPKTTPDLTINSLLELVRND